MSATEGRFLFDTRQSKVCYPLFSPQYLKLQRLQSSSVSNSKGYGETTGFTSEMPSDTVVRAVSALWYQQLCNQMQYQTVPMLFQPCNPMMPYQPADGVNHLAMPIAANSQMHCAAEMHSNGRLETFSESLQNGQTTIADSDGISRSIVPTNNGTAIDESKLSSDMEYVSKEPDNPVLEKTFIMMTVLIPHDLFLLIMQAFWSRAVGYYSVDIKWGDLMDIVVRYITHGPFYVYSGITFGFFDDV